jgi:hypothetical protein
VHRLEDNVTFSVPERDVGDPRCQGDLGSVRSRRHVAVGERVGDDGPLVVVAVELRKESSEFSLEPGSTVVRNQRDHPRWDEPLEVPRPVQRMMTRGGETGVVSQVVQPGGRDQCLPIRW